MWKSTSTNSVYTNKGIVSLSTLVTDMLQLSPLSCVYITPVHIYIYINCYLSIYLIRIRRNLAIQQVQKVVYNSLNKMKKMEEKKMDMNRRREGERWRYSCGERLQEGLLVLETLCRLVPALALCGSFHLNVSTPGRYILSYITCSSCLFKII